MSPDFISANSINWSAVTHQIMTFQLAMDRRCDSGFTEGLMFIVS